MKLNATQIVYDKDKYGCDGLTTEDIVVPPGSMVLVHLVGNMNGVVDTQTDVGKVRPKAVLQRQFTAGYMDHGATQDDLSWAPVEVDGCAVCMAAGNNMFFLAIPGTYRLCFNAPDLQYCFTVYTERINESPFVQYSSATIV